MRGRRGLGVCCQRGSNEDAAARPLPPIASAGVREPARICRRGRRRTARLRASRAACRRVRNRISGCGLRCGGPGCRDHRRLPLVRGVPARCDRVDRSAPGLARPILVAPGSTARRAQIVAAAGVVFVVGISVWNARHASQHILINRDGGAYTNTARWLALHGNLRISAAVGPFATAPGLGSGRSRCIRRAAACSASSSRICCRRCSARRR